MLEIHIIEGTVKVESITGSVTEQGFVLYINTDAKYAVFEAPCEGADHAIVHISVGDQTLRPGDRKAYLKMEESYCITPTTVVIKGAWAVEASSGKHCGRVIGVPHSMTAPENLILSLPFTKEDLT